MWNWYDIFTFSNADPATGKKRTKNGKELRPTEDTNEFNRSLATSINAKDSAIAS